MNPIVQLYKATDQSYCRNICIETAAVQRRRTEKAREALCLLYNDSYTEFEGDICYVAKNSAGHAVGYILCAPDTKAHCRNAVKEYLPRLVKIAPLQAVGMLAEFAVYLVFARKYPAHMHIDISQSYQRMGLGTQFVDTLLATLREKGVSGMFLITDTGNRKGPQFYRKYGFHCVFRFLNILIFAVDI